MLQKNTTQHQMPGNLTATHVSQEVSGNCHQNAQFECRYPHDRAVLCKAAMQAA